MQRKFASCDDPLFLQVSTQQSITCHGLGGNFFSATGGSFLGASQHDYKADCLVEELIPNEGTTTVG